MIQALRVILGRGLFLRLPLVGRIYSRVHLPMLNNSWYTRIDRLGREDPWVLLGSPPTLGYLITGSLRNLPLGIPRIMAQGPQGYTQVYTLGLPQGNVCTRDYKAIPLGYTKQPTSDIDSIMQNKTYPVSLLIYTFDKNDKND